MSCRGGQRQWREKLPSTPVSARQQHPGVAVGAGLPLTGTACARVLGQWGMVRGGEERQASYRRVTCTTATTMRAPRGLTAARTASRDAQARDQALGSPAAAWRSRNTAATAGRLCRCFANQLALRTPPPGCAGSLPCFCSPARRWGGFQAPHASLTAGHAASRCVYADQALKHSNMRLTTGLLAEQSR